jgi:hypothetical protein
MGARAALRRKKPMLKAVGDGGVDSWGQKEEENGGMPPPSSTAKL